MTEVAASPGMSSSVRWRLRAMMFIQYAIHAVWILQVGAYLGGHGFSNTWIGWIGNTAALGCLVAPIFVGMVADRFFASERVMVALNLIGAGLLFWASTITDPWMLFAVLLLQQICYMPTWAIANSIAIANSADTEKDLPSIRVFGSIGWVATSLFGIVCAKNLADFGLPDVKMLDIPWDGTARPMIAGAAMSVLAALLAFTLPHTPPPAAGKKSSVSDLLGLKALSLMKNPSFAVFLLVSMLGMIPFAAYWTFCSPYLKSIGVELITPVMNIGPFCEIFLMWLFLPFALKKFGVKWTLVVGTAGLVVRYLLFWQGNGESLMFMNYLGIAVHGIIFPLFFVTGYIYADQVAPKELRSQAQGLITIATFGAGMLLGNWINGDLLLDGGVSYSNVWAIQAAISAGLMLVMIVFFHVRPPKPADDAGADAAAGAADAG